MSTGRHKQRWCDSNHKRCQLYDPFLWCDGMLSSVVPAAGKRAVCDPKISGGLSYWKHIFHVRFWIENRRV